MDAGLHSNSATGLPGLEKGALVSGSKCLPKGSFAAAGSGQSRDGGEEKGKRSSHLKGVKSRAQSPEPRALSPSYLASEPQLI